MAVQSAEKIKYAGVAQSVEQRIRNAQVGGSSPFTSSRSQGGQIIRSQFYGSVFLCLFFQKSFLSAKHSGEAPHLIKLGFGRALFFVFRTAEIFLVTISQFYKPLETFCLERFYCRVGIHNAYRKCFILILD